MGDDPSQLGRTVAVRVSAAASLPRSPCSRLDRRGHAPGIAPLGRVAQKQFRHPPARGCDPALLQGMEQTLNDIRVALICISQGHQGGR